jgi:amidase
MDLSFASATALAAKIRAREIGCLELLDHAIARVGALDGAVNAVVVRDFERARQRARSLDDSTPNGPLYGVPMTVKESFNVAGLPTTWGVPERRGNIAATNAVAVDRLLNAGAVIFGKTNVPRMLADWQSYNGVYGRTNNPWDLTRTPGGSSGGGAAALAAGLTALEAGSDIGGSIRQPAHACGLFGHKPTWGLVPTFGHSLVESPAMTDISVVGPLARSAADLHLALEVMAGPEETALTFTLPPPRQTWLQGLRIAVWAEQAGQATDPAITTALLDLATALERAGIFVDRTARPAFDPGEAFDLFLKLMAAALSGRSSDADRAETRALAAKLGPDNTSADAVMARSVDMTHATWLGLNQRRHGMRRAWGAFFDEWDVLLCPVIGAPAWPHVTDIPLWQRTLTVGGATVPYNDMLFWSGLVGAFYLPASVAPLGVTAEGLPFGVQIVGPLYGDRLTIEVARQLEHAWRGFTPPPGY